MSPAEPAPAGGDLSDPTFTDTPRGRFSYRSAGAREGEPVVMLHGWPESSYSWRGVTAHLNTGLRVIAPDLRGLGDSTRDGDRAAFQKRELARDVVTLLDDLGIEEFQLVGHDWGGPVAQEIALAVAPRVRRLVLINTPVINNRRGNIEATAIIRADDSRHYWYQHFQQQRDLPEQMISGREEVWLRYFLRNSHGAALPEDTIQEHVRWYSIPGTVGAGANYYRTLREDRHRWDELSGHVWPMPALYIYGNRDPVVIPAYLEHVESCFENLRVESIDAGHFVQEEAPEQVAALLNNFLEANPGTST